MLPAMVDASPQLSLSISSSLFLSFDSYLSRTDTKRADGGGVSYRVRTYTLVQPVGGHVESLVCDGVFFRRCGAERTVAPGGANTVAPGGANPCDTYIRTYVHTYIHI